MKKLYSLSLVFVALVQQPAKATDVPTEASFVGTIATSLAKNWGYLFGTAAAGAIVYVSTYAYAYGQEYAAQTSRIREEEALATLHIVLSRVDQRYHAELGWINSNPIDQINNHELLIEKFECFCLEKQTSVQNYRAALLKDCAQLESIITQARVQNDNWKEKPDRDRLFIMVQAIIAHATQTLHALNIVKELLLGAYPLAHLNEVVSLVHTSNYQKERAYSASLKEESLPTEQKERLLSSMLQEHALKTMSSSHYPFTSYLAKVSAHETLLRKALELFQTHYKEGAEKYAQTISLQAIIELDLLEKIHKTMATSDYFQQEKVRKEYETQLTKIAEAKQKKAVAQERTAEELKRKNDLDEQHTAELRKENSLKEQQLVYDRLTQPIANENKALKTKIEQLNEEVHTLKDNVSQLRTQKQSLHDMQIAWNSTFKQLNHARGLARELMQLYRTMPSNPESLDLYWQQYFDRIYAQLNQLALILGA